MRITRADAPTEAPSLCVAGDYVGSSYFSAPPIHPSLQDHLRTADTAIVNFEAPVATGTPQPKHGPVLGQSADEPQTLADCGFDAVALANNHIMDHGLRGLRATLDACGDADVATVGAGETIAAAIEPLCVRVGETEVAVFNACEKEFGIAGERTPGAVWIGHPAFERVVETTAARADLVAVIAHGGIEYVPLPPPSWRRRLRRLVDAGADAIVGHHPHVPLAWETYRGAPIFYSVGNFAFRNDARPETRWSYLPEFVIAEGGIDAVYVRLLETARGQVRPVTSTASESYWQFLTALADLVQDAVTQPGYWQELALRVFDARYETRLDDYMTGRLASLVQHPVLEGDRLLRGIVRRDDRARTQQLALLNYVQNGCHRDVIETALELKTGVGTDHRTARTNERINRFLAYLDTKAHWSTRRRWMWYLRKIRERLAHD